MLASRSCWHPTAGQGDQEPEERLRTRFEYLTADIQPSISKTQGDRQACKAELLNLDLPDDVAEYIANHLKQNIRQLEGEKAERLLYAGGYCPLHRRDDDRHQGYTE